MRWILLFMLVLLLLAGCGFEDKTIHRGVDYVRLVDDVCYEKHNPNSTAKYMESWGGAYRSCMLQNLNVRDRT